MTDDLFTVPKVKNKADFSFYELDICNNHLEDLSTTLTLNSLELTLKMFPPLLLIQIGDVLYHFYYYIFYVLMFFT